MEHENASFSHFKTALCRNKYLSQILANLSAKRESSPKGANRCGVKKQDVGGKTALGLHSRCGDKSFGVLESDLGFCTSAVAKGLVAVVVREKQ